MGISYFINDYSWYNNKYFIIIFKANRLRVKVYKPSGSYSLLYLNKIEWNAVAKCCFEKISDGSLNMGTLRFRSAFLILFSFTYLRPFTTTSRTLLPSFRNSSFSHRINKNYERSKINGKFGNNMFISFNNS